MHDVGMTENLAFEPPAGTRRLRYIAEFEVEVVDPVQAAAFTMDLSQGDDGSLSFAPAPTDVGKISAAINSVVSRALHASGPDAGFRWTGGSSFVRQLSPDGKTWLPIEIPEVPAQHDE